jgi:hypothetical protein
MEQNAVIDSISDNYLTLLIGKDEKVLVVSLDQLPDYQNLKEGDWLRVDILDNKIMGLKKIENAPAKKRIQDKMEILRTRSNK